MCALCVKTHKKPYPYMVTCHFITVNSNTSKNFQWEFIIFLLTNINYRAKIKIVVSNVQQIILLFIVYFILKKLKNGFNFLDF